jgi:hypothetical protein
VTSAVPGRHPDDDVLADLAAEVLPEVEARVIEAHVIGCPRCADLLGDAERMRRLLLSRDPGPMPDDVLHRIEAALRAEAASRSAGYTGPVAPSAGASRVAADPARGGGGRTPWDDTGTWAATAPLPLPTGTSSSPGSPSRPSRPAGRSHGPVRSRRDVRGESAARGPGRRRGPLLAAAAAVVIAGGLGTLAFTDLLPGSSSDATTALESRASSGAAAAGGGAAVPYATTGTRYTESRLATQVRALVARPGATAGASGTADEGEEESEGQAASGGGASPGPTTAVTRSLTPPAPAVGPGGASSPLSDPARLRECLAAVGASGAQPVRVDLATYEGREAAIIVLPARDGGYEVWAVSPDCGPAGDGLLKFQVVKP